MSDTTTPSSEAMVEPTANADAASPASSAEVVAPDFVLSRDPATLRQQIRELRRNDKDFAQVFGDEAGHYARRTWQPKVSELEAKLEAERNLRERLELEKLDPEEIEKRFASEPDFAVKYAKLVHYTPPTSYTPAVDEDSIREEIVEEVNGLFSWAKAQNLPDEVSNLLRAKAASGAYDRGEAITDWRVPFTRLHQEVVDALLKVRTTPAPVVTAPIVEPTSNPGLTRGGPDLNSSHPNSRPVVMPKSADEFRKLPLDIQRQLVKENAEGVQKLS